MAEFTLESCRRHTVCQALYATIALVHLNMDKDVDAARHSDCFPVTLWKSRNTHTVNTFVHLSGSRET